MTDISERLRDEPMAYDGEESKGWSGSTFLAGIALGAFVGAGVALLFAPDAGWKTRRRLHRQIGDMRDRAEDKWDDLRGEARRELVRRKRNLKSDAQRVAGRARDIVEDVKERL
ncbi:MAG: YtxH domain-containing protein [Gemmatimonadota bacterium]